MNPIIWTFIVILAGGHTSQSIHMNTKDACIHAMKHEYGYCISNQGDIVRIKNGWKTDKKEIEEEEKQEIIEIPYQVKDN